MSERDLTIQGLNVPDVNDKLGLLSGMTKHLTDSGRLPFSAVDVPKQAKNLVYASPSTIYGDPKFRALVTSDVPFVVWLQSSTPGTVQAGNFNASGTGIVGALNVSAAAPQIDMTDTTAAAKSLRVVTDANKSSFYEAAGAAGDIVTLDLANKRTGFGTASPAVQVDISGTAPAFQMTDTTASAKSLRVVTDANVANFYEAAGAAGDIISLDLANNRVGFGTTGALSKVAINGGLHVGGDADAGDNNLLVDGTTTSTGNIYASDKVIQTSANGAVWTSGWAEELVVLNTAGTLTTSVATLLGPNCFIKSVNAYVETTISGGVVTKFSVGDSVTADRFIKDFASLAAGDSKVGLRHLQGSVATDATGPVSVGDNVTITCDATPTQGKVRITVFYEQYSAATS